MNLLLNAGDAMGGKGRIRIRAAADEALAAGRRSSDPPPGRRAELTVVDSGPGIAEADLSRLFDPFFTTKEPGEGTGLGLSVCHQLMESLWGEVRTVKATGCGACLTLSPREAAST